jgi:hypothetical protein
MKDYTPSDTPMGKAMVIAIKIAEKPEPPKGPKPKDAAKLPEGWHYMPDGKVMSNAECDGEHGCMHGQESEDEGED